MKKENAPMHDGVKRGRTVHELGREPASHISAVMLTAAAVLAFVALATHDDRALDVSTAMGLRGSVAGGALIRQMGGFDSGKRERRDRHGSRSPTVER